MSALRIAVSGLHRGENPQPGAGIIRSIRRAHPDAYIAGLIYDAMESGIYAEGGPDAIFPMPYPTNGAEAFLERLDAVLAQSPVDIYIPTLDSEMELLVHLEDELATRGVRTCLPDKAAFARRSKSRLGALANACQVMIPETVSVHSVAGAAWAARKLGYPLLVKGQYYDAKYVSSEIELAKAVSKLLADWGAPAMLQRCVHGPEFNALGLGDGEGGITGLCCIRKTIVSDKGKGLGGMTISDKRLVQMCERLIGELRWRGPFEIEVMRDEERSEYALIEINPRFPAWVDFPSMIGANFPAALVEMIVTGRRPAPLPECPAGHFYLRHQIEVHGHIDQLAALSTSADFAPKP
jgi:carbamoyl-phosphate synthase large subunit